jgi:thiamine-monophosphate kinase
MIDVSDGLAGEVGHIAEESSRGAEIEEAEIPIGPETRRVARHLGVPALDLALHGGEDFELVFTIAAADAHRTAEQVLSETGTAVSIIGKIHSAEDGVVLISPRGKRKPLLTEGYRHF